jgi:hypothetical protein
VIPKTDRFILNQLSGSMSVSINSRGLSTKMKGGPPSGARQFPLWEYEDVAPQTDYRYPEMYFESSMDNDPR